MEKEKANEMKKKVNEVIEKKLRDLKEKLSERLPDELGLTEDQKTAIINVMSDLVDDACALRAAEDLLQSGAIKVYVDKLEDTFKRMSDPTPAKRADKYKQLYYNQRLITSYYQNLVQILQTQIQTIESDEHLFQNVFERLPDVFGPGKEFDFAGMDAMGFTAAGD